MKLQHNGSYFVSMPKSLVDSLQLFRSDRFSCSIVGGPEFNDQYVLYASVDFKKRKTTSSDFYNPKYRKTVRITIKPEYVRALKWKIGDDIIPILNYKNNWGFNYTLEKIKKPEPHVRLADG